jgi:hypothetical protein
MKGTGTLDGSVLQSAHVLVLHAGSNYPAPAASCIGKAFTPLPGMAEGSGATGAAPPAASSAAQHSTAARAVFAARCCRLAELSAQPRHIAELSKWPTGGAQACWSPSWISCSAASTSGRRARLGLGRIVAL